MSCKREVKHRGGLEERGFENKGQNEGFKGQMLDRQGSEVQNWDVSGERETKKRRATKSMAHTPVFSFMWKESVCIQLTASMP